ncbi:hypothetical protein [Halorussus marinus]|uniref:hypothetical protein n=1 Tax=Halorussus marinus TaxID=2505976 RepID=UPI00142F7771|nr:hypothetical protein [Halorussus marinus]
MGIFDRLRVRFRGESSGGYVCTLCGETFDEAAPVLCPDCRGYVVESDATGRQ